MYFALHLYVEQRYAENLINLTLHETCFWWYVEFRLASVLYN